MKSPLPTIVETRRLPSPAVAPQALAWRNGILWIGSRDDCRLYGMQAESWRIVEETATPGIPWAAAAAPDGLYCTVGEGEQDDRYLRRYQPGQGFDASYRIALPEFTGSYLSYQAGFLYLSQWYKHRVLQLDANGNVLRMIGIGAEICGHVFANGRLYVLRGTEQDGESWHVARLDLEEADPVVEDLAHVPFACRSLAFDGSSFWTNHRVQNETVAFALPSAL